MTLHRLPSPIPPEHLPAFQQEYPAASIREERGFRYAYLSTPEERDEAKALLGSLKYGLPRSYTRP